jgi:hypothetical protein
MDVTLAHAAIEAVANGLTLAPLHEPASPASWNAAGWERLGECLKTFRRHFEMTLVDLGPLESIENAGDMLRRMSARELDAVLLVRNRQITSEEEVSASLGNLSASGVTLAGLIENFIAA